MSRVDRWIDNKVVQNLFIWFLLFLILITTIQTDERMLTAVFVIGLLAPAVYINNLLLLPYLRKNTFKFLLLFVINTAVFAVVSTSLIIAVTEETFKWSMYINFFGIMVLALAFASAIKIARDSFTRRQQENEAELKLLKAQLNPHFLFNTLNNLYGLSVAKSDKLPDLMLKLSALLRYSLYETKESLVPLEKELMYLENYISLERIRLEDSTEIQFHSTGDLSSVAIAPMLLIVFVENAFKHLSTSKDNKSTVEVTIKEENGALFFSCNNTIDIKEATHHQLEKGKSGIGLQNVKKRLALIYPEKHTLEITENDNTYSVQLTLTA